MKNLAIATSTRADWGLLLPLARQLRNAGADVSVIATNMHLMPQFGMTVNEITDAGFGPQITVPVSGSRTDITAQTMTGFSNAFETLHPEAVIILGDRFEMAAVAMTAVLKGIPIIHIAGGTISEGAVDDALRHAITKFASLHLVETEKCAKRVMAMGEQPADVVVCGALGVWNTLNVPLMNRGELEESLGRKLPERFITGTLHAATRSLTSPAVQMKAFCNALDTLFREQPDPGAILTYPNNDVDPAPQIKIMEELRDRYPERVILVPTLGMRRYLSACALSEAVAGNSSSGIVEIPSLKVPVLNIGCRQNGRECSEAVIHCDDSETRIICGLHQALSDTAATKARTTPNPYFRPDTPAIMTREIMKRDYCQFPTKKFHES